MSTFILRLDVPGGDGPRLAVKDLIDLAGTPTTAGCKAVADAAEPAEADAPLLAGARAAGARIVGKVNLHELAAGGTGENPWFGTPVNPLDPGRNPGGSSSGSAVVVATDEADVAYGSDTAGSVRIPSACCGTVGLKTTFGRIPLDGVWPLCPSLDTVGPMARDVAGIVLGMQLLEPGFAPASDAATVVGRIRTEGTDAEVEAAVDRALAQAEVEVVEVDLPWDELLGSFGVMFVGEAHAANRDVLARDPAGIGDDVRGTLEFGAAFGEDALADARARMPGWRATVDERLARCQVLALPTLQMLAPRLGGVPAQDGRIARNTAPFNFSGHPALSLPVPADGGFPASLQLVAAHGGEDLLCATGARVEAAVRG